MGARSEALHQLLAAQDNPAHCGIVEPDAAKAYVDPSFLQGGDLVQAAAFHQHQLDIASRCARLADQFGQPCVDDGRYEAEDETASTAANGA